MPTPSDKPDVSTHERDDGSDTHRTSDVPTLFVDYARYEEMLATADMTEAQKHEFLDALWSIIVGFVDLGFGVHPLQQSGCDAIQPCGQNFGLSGVSSDGVVSSKSPAAKPEFTKTSQRHEMRDADGREEI